MNQSLLHIDLRNNKVSPKGGQIIANALKFNKTLLSIGIYLKLSNKSII